MQRVTRRAAALHIMQRTVRAPPHHGVVPSYSPPRQTRDAPPPLGCSDEWPLVPEMRVGPSLLGVSEFDGLADVGIFSLI